MLCGITFNQMKMGKSRNKTSGLCYSDASYPEIRANKRDVIQHSVGSDVRNMENRASVANDAERDRNVRTTPSVEAQLHLSTGGDNKCVYFKELYRTFWPFRSTTLDSVNKINNKFCDCR